MALICAVRSLDDSSSIRRMIESAKDSVSRIDPWPLQRGHTVPRLSVRDGRSRWRDISNRPKREMRPICTRARSSFNAFRSVSSTARWFFIGVISIKSITTKPPMSRKRNWRDTSSAASRLVCSAVSSISPPRVALAELTSTETSASVGSITIEPPEGSCTSRSKAVSIWLSIWNRLNSGVCSLYRRSLLS